MGKVKRQHYVPEFLLTHFVNPEGKLWAYDKVNSKIFPAGTNGVGCEGYFYDDEEIDAAFGNQFLENAFSTAEGQWSRCLSDVVQRIRAEGDQFRIREAERKTISQMAILQMMRTPGHREDSAQLLDGMISHLRKQGATDEILLKSSIPLRLSHQDHKAFHLKTLLDTDSVLQRQHCILNHIWCFFRVGNHGKLYISDEPVVRRPHLKEGWMSHSGIASLGIEIALPLTPDICLVMFEREFFAKMKRLDGSSPELYCPENVLYYNSLQVQGSYRFIYSQSHDFTDAEMICNDDPELRNPKRKSVDFG